MNEFVDEINGHRVVAVSRVTTLARLSAGSVCIRCGAHFVDRLEIENTSCPAAGDTHGHELFTNPDDGLLYCRRCPLVAYDLDDVATEPQCPMPLHSWH